MDVKSAIQDENVSTTEMNSPKQQGESRAVNSAFLFERIQLALNNPIFWPFRIIPILTVEVPKGSIPGIDAGNL